VEDRQGKLVLGSLIALLLATPVVAGPGPDGTASGRLTLNGETVALTHAYARAQPGFFDRAQEDVCVLLSDVPLDAKAQEDTFARIRLGREGRARIVEVVLDAEGQPISGSFYAAAFHGNVSASGMHRFEATRFERKVVAGRLFMETPAEFMGVTYHYQATFEAPIPRPPTPEELAAELASPAGRAALAWLDAVREGRIEQVRALLAPSASWRDERLAELRAETPDDARVTGLARPSPDTAVATCQGTRASDGVVLEWTVGLSLVDGTWRIRP